MKQKADPRNYFGMEQEDYLQAIYHLEHTSGVARISDIARVLGVRKPSASQMVERLEEQGVILHELYAGVRLTQKGQKRALEVLDRHEALVDFFTAIGIPKKVREHDIHGLEHYLSPITLKKLRELTKKLRASKH